MNIILQAIENTKSQKMIVELDELNLTISSIFNGRYKQKTLETYQSIWKMLINKIKIVNINEQNIFHLRPDIYWTIYKKINKGREFLTNTKWVDEETQNIYTFPTTNYYFDGICKVIAGEPGVYGIYNNDTLLYIGYTSIGFNERWEQHKDCFQQKSSTNQMYKDYELKDIEFKEIISLQEIQEIFGINTISSNTWQLIEYCLIKILQPPYNKEGITLPYYFSYNYKNLDFFTAQYDQLFKEYLTKVEFLPDNEEK